MLEFDKYVLTVCRRMCRLDPRLSSLEDPDVGPTPRSSPFFGQTQVPGPSSRFRPTRERHSRTLETTRFARPSPVPSGRRVTLDFLPLSFRRRCRNRPLISGTSRISDCPPPLFCSLFHPVAAANGGPGNDPNRPEESAPASSFSREGSTFYCLEGFC